MKTNLTTGLSALCAILLIFLLWQQAKQKKQLDAFVSATEQRQQEAHDAVSKLAEQVVTLGTNFDSRLTRNAQQSSDAMSMLSNKVLSLATNWEAELTPRLNEKSDEVVAAFSARLNEKANEAATQVANTIRLEAEAALNASVVEHSNKTVRLLEAAGRYEKDGRPELVELCYLSALKCSDGNPGVVLKPMLAWKERSVEAMPENDWLTKSPAMLMALYETLDKALPDSSASPEDMENALAVTDRIQGRIVEHQQTKIKEIRSQLSWDTFDVTNHTAYENSKDVLASFSPANATLESDQNELQALADNLIQTAVAMNSFSNAEVLPPSPKAPPSAITNWFERGLMFIANPTITLDARLGTAAVLMDFARNQTEIPACLHYSNILTNESVRLACAQWNDRVNKYASLVDQQDKPDVDSFAIGQSLLNQGLAIVKSFTNRAVTAEASAALPGLAAKLYLQRELLLVNQMRLVDAPGAFSSKEQTERARSLLYGQILSTIFDAKALEAEIAKQCNPPAESLTTLNDIQKRFGEYLSAYDKFDKADVEDAKAEQLTKLRQQYQRYADYCRSKKDSAYRHYQNADDDRGWTTGWLYTPYYVSWNDTYQQNQLEKGLSDLYSIDVNDLNRADPGLAAEWSSVEETLKKHYGGSPSHVNEMTKKKSINEF